MTTFIILLSIIPLALLGVFLSAAWFVIKPILKMAALGLYVVMILVILLS